MSVHTGNQKKVTVRTLQQMKQAGEKISMLTAYDFTMATLLDAAGVDILLVGDSASNVMAGNITTLSITLEQMIYHGKCVAVAAKRAFVVVDMPFGTVAGNPMKSIDNAVRMMRETGADAIKVEGGEELIDDIRKIVNAGIPVIGHLGLMPQSVNKYGGYTLRGKDDAEAHKLKSDALLLQEAGCVGLVLEKIPSELARTVSETLDIPTIGIGAGNGTDGQVLVLQDMLGMNTEFSPKFLRRYADLQTVISDAVSRYVSDVKSQDFPNESESY